MDNMIQLVHAKVWDYRDRNTLTLFEKAFCDHEM